MLQAEIDIRRTNMIQTYFGNGKGKTTAAVGLPVRCVLR